MRRLVFASLVVLGACASAPLGDVVTGIAPSALPDAVVRAIAAERPDFTPLEVQKKVREGRIYYDVEGELADGAEIEFDVLLQGEVAQIVEIQRDLDWAQVPAEVQAVALSASGGAVPARTIESVQTDGSVIYELFAEGQPKDPAYEVRVHGGKVDLLSERWLH